MTADDLAQWVVGAVMAVVPIAGGWVWRAQSDITTLKTDAKNDVDWRMELIKRLDRLEGKIDNLGSK